MFDCDVCIINLPDVSVLLHRALCSRLDSKPKAKGPMDNFLTGEAAPALPAKRVLTAASTNTGPKRIKPRAVVDPPITDRDTMIIDLTDD